MQQIILPIALVLLATGLVTRVASRRHLSELGQSRKWYNPAHWWTPPWKASTHFSPQGVRQYWISLVLIEVGVVLYIIDRWLY